jgi:hypothetical protein
MAHAICAVTPFAYLRMNRRHNAILATCLVGLEKSPAMRRAFC